MKHTLEMVVDYVNELLAVHTSNHMGGHIVETEKSINCNVLSCGHA